MSRVAVVTGGNKGIGLAIVKGLCEKYDGIVYLTARDVTLGEKAVQSLKALGLSPKFHQLDITDISSIQSFHDFIKEKHGGLDLLINNAAIAFKGASTEPVSVQAEVTMNVNYFAMVNVCNIFLPLLKRGSKVINLSSSEGLLRKIPSKDIREKFANKNLNIEQLNELVNDYVTAAKAGTTVKDGWGNSSYAVSKVAVSALTFIYQREWESRGIIVNAVHPGYVNTDMTSHKGPLTTERGAQSTLYLALEAPESINGAFIWEDSRVVDWGQA